MRFQRLITYFRPYQTQIWHCRHCPRSPDIRNSKCRRKPEVILTSGCPPMSNRVGQCRYCLTVVGVTEKCGVCRWDFANISFHSRDPVYFQFTVRHLEFRMIQASTMSAMAQVSWAWSKIGGSRWNFVSMWLRTGDMGGGNFTPLGYTRV